MENNQYQFNEHKNNKRKLLYVIGPIALIIALAGVTYAFFNYTRTGATSTLVVGNIYFNHTEGTAINLNTVFPMTREEARARNDNYITFQVTGKNESDSDVFYKLLLSHGDEVENRDRIGDQYLRFDLIEILSNNEEKYIIYNESFSTINNTVLVKDRVDANTTSNVTKNYKLRMWIDGDILISDTDSNRDYTTTAWNNLFASVKVTVVGDMQDVKYYDAFSDVMTAINSETYVSTVSRAEAKAGIYIDSFDNSTNVVLYDDLDINDMGTIVKPVDINLYGYSLNFKKNQSNYSTLIFVNKFILENGSITAEDNTNQTTFPYGIVAQGESGVINDIDFSYISNGNTSLIGTSGNVNLTVKNSKADGTQLHSNNTATYNIINSELDAVLFVKNTSTMKIVDSSVEHSRSPVTLISIQDSGSKLIVDNTNIFADSPGCYVSTTTGDYYNDSIGIYNAGTLIFNSGYVFGTYAAVGTSLGSKTYVYGGTFESTDHGGFYFAHGPSGVAYIENANIRGISYPSRGRYRQNGIEYVVSANNQTYALEEVKAAFYLGGDSNNNEENLYLVNCNISGEQNALFVMSYMTPLQNIYMSGTKLVNTTSSQYLRIDVPNGMRLYNGSNNDFGLVDKFGPSSTLVSYADAKQNGTIVETNANYKGIVSPQ